MRAINDQEREVFEAIRNASNIAVASTELDGEETSVIVSINREGNGDYTMYPLAVLVTDGMMNRLTPPSEDVVRV